MKIKKAKLEELDKICNYYSNVCSKTPRIEDNAKWVFGVYPNAKMLKDFVEREELYIIGDYASVTVIATEFEDMFNSIPWGKNKSAELSLFSVNPLLQGSGISVEIMENIEDYLLVLGYESIKLCTIDCNNSAKRYYTKCGFKYKGSLKDNTPNITWKNIDFYEKVLGE